MDVSPYQEQERAVGITAFVSPDVPGFQCTIKHRYTDFLVNEVSSDGHVLHLSNLSAKPTRQKQTTAADAKVVPLPSDNVFEGHSDKDQVKRKRPDGDQRVGVDSTSAPAKKQRTGEQPSIVDVPKRQNDTGNGERPFESNAPDDSIGSRTDAERKAEIASQIPESDKSRLENIFGEATMVQILNLYANVVIHPDRKPRDQPTVRSEVIAEKAKRTEAHIAVRQVFASKLSTEMIQDSPGVIAIRAAPTKGPSGARGQLNSNDKGAYQKGKLGWEELGGEYVHFTLYKENKDTMEVLYFLASNLKIPVKNFQFAGTKDRRGVTVQRVAIFRVHADRLAGLNKTARGWRIGDFEYKRTGLELGELGGNEFLLTLRECHFADEDGVDPDRRLELAEDAVRQATASFKARGFINYYGLQRFGTYTTGTHATGMKMLKGDLEGAVDSILTYSPELLPENLDTTGMTKVPQDDIDRADAIRTWREKRTSNDACSRLPRRFQAEAAIIQYLGKKDRKTGQFVQATDWQGALMQIQRGLRLMYVHAYQSLVWNTVAGRRWQRSGNKVVEGDLVIVGEKDEPRVKKDVVDEDGEPVFHPAADDSAPTTEDSFVRARPLSKEEAESGKYTIFDVVLPQPGFDVLYPANEIGKFYEEFMASEEGGGLDPHNMRRSWKDISLSGGYRKLLARPGDGFGYEIKTYVNSEEQVVQTDLEKLQGRTGSQHKSNGDASNEAVLSGEPQKIAIVLKLQLGSSQYATMALRELTKGGAVNYKPDYSSR